MQNLYTGTLPAADLQKALDHIRQAAALLQPHFTPLTPEQRSQMLKMGPATVDFIRKARDYAQQNEKFRPDFLDAAEFERDAADVLGLAPLAQLLAGLELDADSTLMTAGSDAYAAALVVYAYVKMLAKNGVPGAQAAYDDMRQSLPSAQGRPAKAAGAAS